MGKETYEKNIEDSDYFPIKNEDYYLHAIMHTSFLVYKYKTSISYYGVPNNEDDYKAVCNTTHSCCHQADHFQFVKTRKIKELVCKNLQVKKIISLQP